MSWFVWALLSAFFAGLTAILAKVGVVQNEIRTNLSFMRTPAYDGCELLGKTSDCADKKRQR